MVVEAVDQTGFVEGSSRSVNPSPVNNHTETHKSEVARLNSDNNFNKGDRKMWIRRDDNLILSFRTQWGQKAEFTDLLGRECSSFSMVTAACTIAETVAT